MRVNTTTVHVESMSVSAIIVISNERTTSVVTVNSLALLAYNTSDSGSDSRGKLTSGTSVRSNLVESVFIDTLDDIDFTVVRPVVADGPVCGPSTTAVGHRPHISDEKTSSIVFLLRVDVNTRNTQREFFKVSNRSSIPLQCLLSSLNAHLIDEPHRVGELRVGRE